MTDPPPLPSPAGLAHLVERHLLASNETASAGAIGDQS